MSASQHATGTKCGCPTAPHQHMIYPAKTPVKSLLRVMSDLCQSTGQLPMSGNDLGVVLFWLSDLVPENDI